MSNDLDRESVDEEGEVISIETLVCQQMELIATIISKRQFAPLLATNLPSLCYELIGYLQLTNEEMDLMEDDPNQFVADEDVDIGVYNVRYAGMEVLQELASKFKLDAVKAFVTAFQQRMTESHQLMSQKQEHWWKLREACILAIGSVTAYLLKNQVLDLKGLLATFLTSDLSANGMFFFYFYTTFTKMCIYPAVYI